VNIHDLRTQWIRINAGSHSGRDRDNAIHAVRQAHSFFESNIFFIIILPSYHVEYYHRPVIVQAKRESRLLTVMGSKDKRAVRCNIWDPCLSSWTFWCVWWTNPENGCCPEYSLVCWLCQHFFSFKTRFRSII